MTRLTGLRSSIVALGISTLCTPQFIHAQQVQLDTHGSLSVTTSTHSRSWGAGIGPQVTFGSSLAPLQLSTSPSFDYVKQEHGGPSQESLSLDVSVQPGGSSTVTPYAGVSPSANWSSGSGKQWDGSRRGLEALAGIQIKATSTLSAKVEERFGYVKGQEHFLTTRLGILAKL